MKLSKDAGKKIKISHKPAIGKIGPDLIPKARLIFLTMVARKEPGARPNWTVSGSQNDYLAIRQKQMYI
ncbi:MAG: hypothetical protein OHK0053_37780 [Microscillaceae bacterium]